MATPKPTLKAPGTTWYLTIHENYFTAEGKEPKVTTSLPSEIIPLYGKGNAMFLVHDHHGLKASSLPL
jgi:hypothetical protein